MLTVLTDIIKDIHFFFRIELVNEEEDLSS